MNHVRNEHDSGSKPCVSTQKLVAMCSVETSVESQQAIWRFISEDSTVTILLCMVCCEVTNDVSSMNERSC